MDRAKRIMANYLQGHADDAWDVNRHSLAADIESWFVRPKKKDNPANYITVEEQRDLRLAIIGALLDRENKNPLTSFNEPDAEHPGNMTLIEARALRTFINRASLDVHAEVKVAYESNVGAMLSAKEKAIKAAEEDRRRLSQFGQVDRFGDLQLYLPIVSGTGAG